MSSKKREPEELNENTRFAPDAEDDAVDQTILVDGDRGADSDTRRLGSDTKRVASRQSESPGEEATDFPNQSEFADDDDIGVTQFIDDLDASDGVDEPDATVIVDDFGAYGDEGGGPGNPKDRTESIDATVSLESVGSPKDELFVILPEQVERGIPVVDTVEFTGGPTEMIPDDDLPGFIHDREITESVDEELLTGSDFDLDVTEVVGEDDLAQLARDIDDSDALGADSGIPLSGSNELDDRELRVAPRSKLRWLLPLAAAAALAATAYFVFPEYFGLPQATARKGNTVAGSTATKGSTLDTMASTVAPPTGDESDGRDRQAFRRVIELSLRTGFNGGMEP